MAAKTSWHRYGTKLRHFPAMGAEFWDEHVCLCLSASISPKLRVIFSTNFYYYYYFLAHQHKACRQQKIKQEMTAVGD